MVQSIALACILLFFASSASGQQIHGIVRDASSGEPLTGTLLVVLDRDSVLRATAMSDSTGKFALGIPADDSVRLFVQHLGFRSETSEPIVLQPAQDLELAIGLRPTPVALEGLTVTAPMNRKLEAFARRRENGLGKYFGPEDVWAARTSSAEALLWRLPGAFLFPGGSGRGVTAIARGGRRCVPNVFVDGYKVARASEATLRGGEYVPLTAYVSAQQIRGIEVYRTPAEAPPEAQEAFMGDCPVVLIWTDVGFGMPRRE